jgi:hypothetical protein
MILFMVLFVIMTMYAHYVHKVVHACVPIYGCDHAHGAQPLVTNVPFCSSHSMPQSPICVLFF